MPLISRRAISNQILLILLILSKTSTRSTCSTRLTIFSFVYLVYFVVHISLRTLRPCASALKHLHLYTAAILHLQPSFLTSSLYTIYTFYTATNTPLLYTIYTFYTATIFTLTFTSYPHTHPLPSKSLHRQSSRSSTRQTARKAHIEPHPTSPQEACASSGF